MPRLRSETNSTGECRTSSGSGCNLCVSQEDTGVRQPSSYDTSSNLEKLMVKSDSKSGPLCLVCLIIGIYFTNRNKRQTFISFYPVITLKRITLITQQEEKKNQKRCILPSEPEGSGFPLSAGENMFWEDQASSVVFTLIRGGCVTHTVSA